MSLILEALKKSEQQRRLGEMPNLGTPVTATSDAPRFEASRESLSGCPATTSPSSARASKVMPCAASTAS